MARPQSDKSALIRALPRFTYKRPDGREQDRFDQASLAHVLLLLAELKHETEYNLCRAVAERLLGKIPEPDDGDLGAE